MHLRREDDNSHTMQGRRETCTMGINTRGATTKRLAARKQNGLGAQDVTDGGIRDFHNARITAQTGTNVKMAYMTNGISPVLMSPEMILIAFIGYKGCPGGQRSGRARS